VKEVAPGLWQLSGFPPNVINVYVAGDVLIDAATKWASRRILRQVRSLGLTELALTHVHADHQGSAKVVCAELGVPLACHVDDVDAMEGRVPAQRAHVNHLANRFGRAVFLGPPRKVDRVLHEGDMVGEFRVVHAPGHAPGEVIFFRDSDRAAICGDVITTINVRTGLPGVHISPWYYTYDMEQAKASVVKLLDLAPSVICPGHGKPLHDIAQLEAFVEREGLRG
jgi:glyoxylase-like metal-dependent hydrolase (beta-lactamase superfamily II)